MAGYSGFTGSVGQTKQTAAHLYLYFKLIQNLTFNVFIHYLHKKHGLAEVQNI